MDTQITKSTASVDSKPVDGTNMGKSAAAFPAPPIDPRFTGYAEQRGQRLQQFNLTVEYEDIGERLLELRKIAWDRYGACCLWNIRPDATYGAMHSVAWRLRYNGDLEAAFLAAAILLELEGRTDRPAGWTGAADNGQRAA